MVGSAWQGRRGTSEWEGREMVGGLGSVLCSERHWWAESRAVPGGGPSAHAPHGPSVVLPATPQPCVLYCQGLVATPHPSTP